MAKPNLGVDDGANACQDGGEVLEVLLHALLLRELKGRAADELEELGEGLLVLEREELVDAARVGGEELVQLPQRGLEALAIALLVQQALYTCVNHGKHVFGSLCVSTLQPLQPHARTHEAAAAIDRRSEL